MQDWNVIITVREKGLREAVQLFEGFEAISRTYYFNVLVTRSGDVDSMTEALHREIEESPGLVDSISPVVPVTEIFTFKGSEEYESPATGIVLQWVSKSCRFLPAILSRATRSHLLNFLYVALIIGGLCRRVIQILVSPGNAGKQIASLIFTFESIVAIYDAFEQIKTL